LRRKLRRAVSQNDCRYASKLPRVCPAQVRHADRINIAGAVYWARSPFLQPVKPRWPSICICKYMVRVSIRVRVSVTVTVRVTVRVCHDMFRTRSPMFDRLQRCQDTSDPRHFGTGAEASVRHFGTGAEVSGHFATGAEMSVRHFGTDCLL